MVRNPNQAMRLELLLTVYLFASVGAANTPVKPPLGIIAKPGCEHSCGSIEIPYPFGLGDDNGCSLSKSYRILCNKTTDPPTAIYNGNISLLNVSLNDNTFRVASPFAYQCYEDNHNTTDMIRIQLPLAPFSPSSTRNKFVSIGCDTLANVVGSRGNMDSPIHYATGCTAFCTADEKLESGGNCTGVGCCETPIPEGILDTEVSAWSFFNHAGVDQRNPCSAAAVVEKDEFQFSEEYLTAKQDRLSVLKLPMVVDWWIEGGSCDSSDKLCSTVNANCSSAPRNKGYRCTCNPGFKGNPYLQTGCSEKDECYVAPDEYCKKLKGYCDQPKATEKHYCDQYERIGLGLCFSVIIILFGVLWWMMQRQRKKLVVLRERFFYQNGGLILSKKLRDRDISTQKFKIFTLEEMKKATNNYSQSSVVGNGGFGIVYKGILGNGQVVAIKRSLRVDPTHVEHFINEVLVLSEVNNKNIVKLLGCCLEVEVPLLVYEFINNGTLYEHLQDDRRAMLLPWDIRLNIAESVASVLSYLHTTVAIPIIHRDIKSMNILLDENYTAKVSDFGASKLGPVDHSQLTTVVLGTWGYLDPEYMQTSELTEKSDVYSFGVVLVELLTRKKAIFVHDLGEQRSLAMLFLCKLKEDKLFDIIDEDIAEAGNLDEIKEVAKLAKQCLALKGDERPTMKRVTRELEALRSIGNHPWPENDEHIDEYKLLFIETLLHSESSVNY